MGMVLAACLFAIMLFGYQALLKWSYSKRWNRKPNRIFFSSDGDEREEKSKSADTN